MAELTKQMPASAAASGLGMTTIRRRRSPKRAENLAQVHEVRNAVERHARGQGQKRQQHENEIGGLLLHELESVKAALLDFVDSIDGFLQVRGIANVEKLAARRGNILSDVL